MSDLTERERALLARRVAIRHLKNIDGWLEWEDLPGLGQLEFERVVDAAAAFVDQLSKRLNELERSFDIDSAELLERADS